MKDKVLKFLTKTFILFRQIIGIFFIFVGIFGLLSNISDITNIITGIVIIFIGYLIYPNLKELILNKVSSLKKIDIKNELVKSYNQTKENIVDQYNKIEIKKENTEEYIDDLKGEIYESNIYDEYYNDYQSFKCGNKTFKPYNNNVFVKWGEFWDEIIKAYSQITIKQEGVKQYGDVEGMKKFEEDIHIFFKDRVLEEAKKQGFIDNINPSIKETKSNYSEDSYYSFFGRNLTIEEYNEAIRIFNIKQQNSQQYSKKQIYDLYCKSLRRVGNFYKKYKEWELALKVFKKIKEFGFEGIMDGKSIIKCQKEIDLKNKKLLK